MTGKVSQLCKGILLTQLNQEPLLQNDINIQTTHSLLRDSTLSQGRYEADSEHISLQEGVRSAMKPFLSFSLIPIDAKMLGTFAECKARELGGATFGPWTRCARETPSNLMHSVVP